MIVESQDRVIDVTRIEPKNKHPYIFENFDALHEGQGFVIHNDHDPKPLYYQLLAEKGNTFTWEYILQGPEVWEVRITKNDIENEETIGEIAASDLRKAAIFKKYGLDFCCGGKNTLRAACQKKGLNYNVVQEELSKAELTVSGVTLPYNDWPLDFLVDFIVQTHHLYVRKTLPDMQHYAVKVAKRHSELHPELKTIEKNVEAIAKELNAHMMKEERILFPLIKETTQKAAGNKSGDLSATFDSIQKPVYVMEMEHELVGELMQEIRTISNQFTPPADACNSYKLLFSILEAFESDLHIHIHLENNILFPKAISLWNEMYPNEIHN